MSDIDIDALDKQIRDDEMRRLRREECLTYRALAAKFGVTYQRAHQIVNMPPKSPRPPRPVYQGGYVVTTERRRGRLAANGYQTIDDALKKVDGLRAAESPPDLIAVWEYPSMERVEIDHLLCGEEDDA